MFRSLYSFFLGKPRTVYKSKDAIGSNSAGLHKKIMLDLCNNLVTSGLFSQKENCIHAGKTE